MGGPIPQAVSQRQSLSPVPYIPIQKWLMNSHWPVVDSHYELQVNWGAVKTSPSSALPGAMAAPCRRAGSAQPTCHFDCCRWLRPHRGEFAKTPHSVELGSWYHLLWLWFCALTGRFVVIEISQVGCHLSLKASQGNTAKSYIRKKGRWEKGWRKPAPELRLQQCRGLQGVSGGALPPTPLLGSPERRPSPSTFPVGIWCSQQNP